MPILTVGEVSLYSPELEGFLVSLNNLFVSHFKLTSPYRASKFPVGEARGFISWISFGPPPYQSVNGIERDRVISLEMLISVAVATREDATKIGMRYALELDQFAGVASEDPSTVDAANVYRLRNEGAIENVTRLSGNPDSQQNIYYYIDIIGSLSIRVATKKEPSGLHLPLI